MDQFALFAERVSKRPLVIVKMNKDKSVTVQIFFSHQETGHTGFLQHVWDPDNIVGSRLAAPEAHATKAASILQEPFMGIPISIVQYLHQNVIIITRLAENDEWGIADSTELANSLLTYVAMSLGNLHSNRGAETATKIWSALTLYRTLPLLLVRK